MITTLTGVGTGVSAGWNMHRLQLDLIFGIGAFFLYILVPVALLANEVRLAKGSDDTSGSASILDAMMQAVFFIITWLLFVTIFTFILVGLVTTVDNNPVIGIYDFWHVDWLNPSVLVSLDSSHPIFLSDGAVGLEQARSIVFFLSFAKTLEIILLAVMLLLVLKLSLWLPLYKMRRTSHSQMTSELDVSAAISLLMMFTVGIIIYNFIMGIDNMLLDSVFQLATARNPGLGSLTFAGGTKINILNDVWILLNNGRNAINAGP